MSQTVLAVLWIGFTIWVWWMYHKIFTVYYFSLSQGLMKELLISALIGMLLTGLTISLWWLSAIIIVGAGLLVSGKVENPSSKKAVLILFIVAAVVIAIVGLQAGSGSKGADTSGASTWILDESSSYMV